MGNSRWSSDAYTTLKSDYSKMATDDIFTSRNDIDPSMSPVGVKYRESRDSEAHPESLAIGIFLDVTGSMGVIPEILVRQKLGALVETMLNHGIEHPAIMFGAIGDHIADNVPLQVGQFESGTIELNEWLTKTFLEGGGGGQNMESYLLAYLFSARHTSIDCFEKRGTKGFLFTIGDEKSWDQVDADHLKAIMGYPQSDPITLGDILAEVQRTYHVFHVHINQTGYKDDPDVIGHWRGLLGERLIILDDYNALAEVIASTVAVMRGVDLASVTASFDSATAALVNHALLNVANTDLATTNKGIIDL